MIFWITLFTQAAWGSRQTSWPVALRVALQHQAGCGHTVSFTKPTSGKISICQLCHDLHGMKALELGLTWSLSLRSGSWEESVPPYWCGGQCVCSRFGCSGSAALLPGFFYFLCSFLQEITHGYTVKRCLLGTKNWCIEEKRKNVHTS